MGIGTVIGALAIGGSLVMGKPVLNLLYGAQYAEYHVFFTWLMVGGAISYVSSFLGYGTTAARIFKIQVVINLITVSTTAIISFWVIPNGNLTDVSKVLIGTNLANLICYGVVIYYLIAKRPEQFRIETA